MDFNAFQMCIRDSYGVHVIPRPHSDVEYILPHLDRDDEE